MPGRALAGPGGGTSAGPCSDIPSPPPQPLLVRRRHGLTRASPRAALSVGCRPVERQRCTLFSSPAALSAGAALIPLSAAYRRLGRCRGPTGGRCAGPRHAHRDAARRTGRGKGGVEGGRGKGRGRKGGRKGEERGRGERREGSGFVRACACRFGCGRSVRRRWEALECRRERGTVTIVCLSSNALAYMFERLCTSPTVTARSLTRR